MWNDQDYDNWKLATPYDDEPNIEVFKAEKYEVYSTNEDDIHKFDESMESVQYHVIQAVYESREDYLDECFENIVDNISLHSDEVGAMGAFMENDYSLYLDAVENGYKGKYKRGY